MGEQFCGTCKGDRLITVTRPCPACDWKMYRRMVPNRISPAMREELEAITALLSDRTNAKAVLDADDRLRRLLEHAR